MRNGDNLRDILYTSGDQGRVKVELKPSQSRVETCLTGDKFAAIPGLISSHAGNIPELARKTAVDVIDV